MIHKTTRSILSVLLAVLLLVTSTPLTPAFAGEEKAVSLQSESGESEGLMPVDGVYQIYTADDLKEFAVIVNGTDSTPADSDANAKLMNDIDLNPDMKIGEDGEVANGDDLDPWTPIGTSNSNLYSGTFDGDGHTISGLYIDSSANYQGLFGYLITDGINTGTVQNLSVSGSVSGNNYVGGVVGYNDGGRVENCHNIGSVSGDRYVGGVVGDNRGTVENCHNIGEVSGDRVGGVVGDNNGGTVENCYNTGKVTGTYDYVGGVVGRNFGGTVENCYNTGKVSGPDSSNSSTSDVGGVVGRNVGNVEGWNRGTVENCYNTGTVTGTYDYVGGVVGYNYSGGSVTNSYNTGEVSGKISVGGVVGYNHSGGSVTDCYFLKTNELNNGLNGIGGDSSAAGAESLTADQFKNQKSFTKWDFGSTGIPGIWETNTTLGRPVLTSNHEDDGSKDHPYEIFTATQLKNFATAVNTGSEKSAHAKLMNNINLSSVCGAELNGGTSWTPIGSISNKYTGNFNGDGHKIENLYINTTDSGADNQGLFGYVSGTVKDLTVSGNVSADWNVGGVVGLNHGSVENCYNIGDVSGNRYVGGVVGDNRGTVENCYNTGTVSDGGISGGVVGCNQGGSVQNCYNTGAVSGSEFVGGVVGYNLIRSTVENCYNIGAVSGNSSVVGGVVGYNDSSGTVKGCYFLQTETVNTQLQGIGDGSGDAAEKDDTAFHSGEVAWRLQAGQKAAGEEDPIPQVWGQSNLTTENSWPTLVALDKDAKPVYKVAFISDNTEIEAKYANSGMTVGSPTTNPTKEGYTFAGWFTESSGGSQWNFNDPVNKSMTLYAQWTEATPDPDPTPTPTPDPTPSGPSTGDSSGWDDIRDELENTAKGEQITIDMGDETKVPAEIFESLAGKDVEISFDLGDVQWTVNGADIPTDTDFTDLDLGVNLDTSGIPVNVINTITGEVGTVQITLAHNGEFGFTMTLTAPLGKENAGYWANLYHYDEDAEALNFEAAAEIDEDGNVKIPFTHASQYAIVIDTHGHAAVDVSDLFSDIARDAWYKDAVQYAYDNGLMTGVSDTEFAPEATTTRAMIVSILARLEGVESAQAAGFADVDDNDWYATAVNWAANVGVVNGYEDNTFRPNTAITREQLAAILMNYAVYKGEDVSNRADLTSYTDQPSTWAQETMQWAVAEGLISGVTADTLQPQGAATRAQVAAILQRFLSE